MQPIIRAVARQAQTAETIRPVILIMVAAKPAELAKLTLNRFTAQLQLTVQRTILVIVIAAAAGVAAAVVVIQAAAVVALVLQDLNSYCTLSYEN